MLWCGTESNRRHMDFQSIALPTELPHLQAFSKELSGTPTFAFFESGRKCRRIFKYYKFEKENSWIAEWIISYKTAWFSFGISQLAIEA